MDCYFAEGPHTERVCGVSGQMCRYASLFSVDFMGHSGEGLGEMR